MTYAMKSHWLQKEMKGIRSYMEPLDEQEDIFYQSKRKQSEGK
jgi:hypothetical protein